MNTNTNYELQGKNVNQHETNQVPYKQTFQCPCSKIFGTLDEYQFHIENDNHDSYRLGLSNGEPIGKQPYKNHPETHHINQIPKLSSGNFLNFNQNDRHFPIQSRPSHYFLRNLEDSTSFGQKSYINPSDPFQQSIYNDLQEQNTRQSKVQQNQQSFKYIQAYYENKMAPFYRQFDIDPLKPPANNKLTFYNGASHPSSQKNFIKPKVSTKFTRSDAANDLNKVIEELSVRMIPVENSIIEFIYTFTCENFQRIAQIKEEDVSKIEQNLQENINQLAGICYKRKIIPQNNNFFMETDIDVAIRTFLEFLKQFLRQNQLWVAYLMLIPIIQSIIKYHEDINHDHEGNLKLIDVSQLMSFIKTKQFTTENLPIKVESDKIFQFLIWFTQWFTMIQFVKNKWSIEYIEPLYEQIHYINRIYQDNVQKYQKFVQQQRNEVIKRSKRKWIEKSRKMQKNSSRRKRQLHQLMKSSNYNNNYYIIGDWNNQKIKENRQQQQFLKKYAPNPQSGNLNKNGSQNIEEEPIQKRKNSIQIEKESIVKQKRISKSILENQQLNSEINSLEGSDKDDLDDDEMKEAYISAFKSQYVSYFSPESIEARKIEEEKWMKKLQKLNKILKNPKNFKPQLYSEVSRQLRDLDELIAFVGIDFQLFSCYQHQILKRVANTKVHRDCQNQNQNIPKFDLIKEQKIEVKGHSQNYDPFIIQKNFRSRNISNSNYIKTQSPSKEIGESQENVNKTVLKNNDEFQVYQKINPQISQKKQVQKQQEIQKSMNEKIKNEVDQELQEGEDVSNEFFDEFF